MESFCQVMMVPKNFVKAVSVDLRKGFEPVVKKAGHKYDDKTFFDDISYKDAATYLKTGLASLQVHVCLGSSHLLLLSLFAICFKERQQQQLV